MKPIFKTPDTGYFFSGYYDKSPFDSDDNKLLAMKAGFMDRTPERNDTLEIGYFEWKKNNKFIKIAETKAWNWQQGCMLQWMGPGFNRHVIYNDIINNKFVSVMLDVYTKEKKIMPMAIYALSPDGRSGLCIDNERHYWFRGGYNYKGIENKAKNIPIDKNDGIWLLDFEKGTYKQIINIADLLSINPLSVMKDSIHYIEHLMFNPRGNRFAFLHRFRLEAGGIYTRLFTAGTEGENIFLLNDSGRTSHYCWRYENEILAYCSLQTPVNRLRRYSNINKIIIKPMLPFYHMMTRNRSKIRKIVTGDSYVLLRDMTGNKSRIINPELKEDGHMSFHPEDKDIFVSDTYENGQNFRKLFLYNLKEDRCIDIDLLKSDTGTNSTAYRCDLHPKWSYSGKYLVIDTVNEGFRQIYVYEA